MSGVDSGVDMSENAGIKTPETKSEGVSDSQNKTTSVDKTAHHEQIALEAQAADHAQSIETIMQLSEVMGVKISDKEANDLIKLVEEKGVDHLFTILDDYSHQRSTTPETTSTQPADDKDDDELGFDTRVDTTPHTPLGPILRGLGYAPTIMKTRDEDISMQDAKADTKDDKTVIKKPAPTLYQKSQDEYDNEEEVDFGKPEKNEMPATRDVRTPKQIAA